MKMEMTLELVQLQQKDLLISILVRELFDKYCITDKLVDSYKFPRVLSLDLNSLGFPFFPPPPTLTNGIGQNVPLGKNCYGVQMNRGGRGLLSKETVLLHQWGSITR